MSVLRLIDANLNRAREGLRVLEDYARFVLDSRAIGERLKAIRHRLAEATRTISAEAISHRDTPGDVGTSYAVDRAMPREKLADVVIAAGKRTGEALRSVEEYAKTIDATIARAIEATRYAFYDVEAAIARTFAPANERLSRVRLYVLISQDFTAGRDWFDCARAALEGGADAIQLREKTMEAGELLRRARRLVPLCREFDALCIINDRPDVAVLSDADGVHVGQGDLPAREARKIVGPDRIVGVSTHRIDQARQAVIDGADYLGVGPVFPSATKPREFVSGLDYAREVAEEIRLPAVAIAGVTLDNIADVQATGVRAVAVTGAVIGAADVREAARAFKTRLADREIV